MWQSKTEAPKRKKMEEEEFRKLAIEKGYGAVEFQEIGPGPEEEMHAHEHSVLSLVLSGEFTMTTDKWTKVFKAGGMCENPAGTMHKETTGPEGGSYLFAKRLG
jgi:quercetin dioxygenase-like cupin family protein